MEVLSLIMKIQNYLGKIENIFFQCIFFSKIINSKGEKCHSSKKKFPRAFKTKIPDFILYRDKKGLYRGKKGSIFDLLNFYKADIRTVMNSFSSRFSQLNFSLNFKKR